MIHGTQHGGVGVWEKTTALKQRHLHINWKSNQNTGTEWTRPRVHYNSSLYTISFAVLYQALVCEGDLPKKITSCEL